MDPNQQLNHNNPFGGQQPGYNPQPGYNAPPQPGYNAPQPGYNAPQQQYGYQPPAPQMTQPGFNNQGFAPAPPQQPGMMTVAGSNFEHKTFLCINTKCGPGATPHQFLISFLTAQRNFAIFVIIVSLATIYFNYFGFVFSLVIDGLLIFYCNNAINMLNSPAIDANAVASAGTFSFVMNILGSIGYGLVGFLGTPLNIIVLMDYDGYYNRPYSKIGYVILVVNGIIAIVGFFFTIGQACQHSKFKLAVLSIASGLGAPLNV